MHLNLRQKAEVSDNLTKQILSQILTSKGLKDQTVVNTAVEGAVSQYARRSYFPRTTELGVLVDRIAFTGDEGESRPSVETLCTVAERRDPYITHAVSEIAQEVDRVITSSMQFAQDVVMPVVNELEQSIEAEALRLRGDVIMPTYNLEIVTWGDLRDAHRQNAALNAAQTYANVWNNGVDPLPYYAKACVDTARRHMPKALHETELKETGLAKEDTQYLTQPGSVMVYVNNILNGANDPIKLASACEDLSKCHDEVLALKDSLPATATKAAELVDELLLQIDLGNAAAMTYVAVKNENALVLGTKNKTLYVNGCKPLEEFSSENFTDNDLLALARYLDSVNLTDKLTTRQVVDIMDKVREEDARLVAEAEDQINAKDTDVLRAATHTVLNDWVQRVKDKGIALAPKNVIDDRIFFIKRDMSQESIDIEAELTKFVTLALNVPEVQTVVDVASNYTETLNNAESASKACADIAARYLYNSCGKAVA